ncbi:hypothetical protein ACNQ1H_26440, partial [Enterobacter cloacae complex sp.6722787]|uniref:hypothetical protein n=1 Tax=Enterobacteriaceae TaxID=543 RepID=UPI002ECFB083|nr:hypothetical protein [Klebsiella pneumoniae]
MTTQTFQLSQALKTHDGDVTELKLKPPRVSAFVKYNDPFRIEPRTNGEGEFTGVNYVFNNKVMMQFLAEMTGVDDLLLGDLSTVDFLNLRAAAANMIVGFTGGKNPS